MYKKVDTSLNFVEREKEIVEYWNEEKVFEESMQATEGNEEFSFYDGPPTANGKPHIGHILTRVMKDIVPRYQTMKGKHVLRKAGWDTHGLPVELEVEKKLGLESKTGIESYGIEPFILKCKESVWQYSNEWKKMSDRVGYWCDMDNPYVTYHDDYIESEWWAIKEIHKKGLLYKGHKIVPYCPRCGTALSSHEVAQGYKDVKQLTAFVKFKVKDAENTYILAWTTTPWTLPSNVALCMNPAFDYVMVEMQESGEKYILAEGLLKSVLGEEGYTVLSTKKGTEYEYTEYEPLYPFGKEKFNYREKAHYVTCDNYVTLSDGTGVVHIAPAFGEDDYKVGKRYNLPVVQLITEEGKFPSGCGEFTGIGAQAADPLVVKDLKARDLLLKTMEFTHNYPFCWRCDTPLIYYARSSWFIKVTEIKDRLIETNRSVNWMPDTIKEGRMGNFLENVIDWGLSRDRYWGTPLPVWVCEECGEIEVIGSREELAEKCGAPKDIELHRPYLDDLTCKCGKCGGKMRRTPEVIDCWFDSGSMPFAQYHYPFENKALFEQTFPADFISEAVDQTRGWFYTLLVISTLLFDKAPFKNCIVLGHVNDKNGIKMSKHKGNVVDPWTVLDKQGADAVRWYFYTSSAPWLPSRFYPEAVSEAQRKYMGTLWNTYAFFCLYADIDGYDPSKYDLKNCKLSLMDKWILSKLNTLVDCVDKNLAVYNITDSARALQDFTDILSNWYVRRGRDRYWGSEMTEDKAAAYTTLWHVLVTFAKLTAPYTPFIAEQMYLNLVPAFFKDAPKSVHLCSFPEYDASMVDETLEKGMDTVLDIVNLGRAARNSGNVKNRQPLSEMYVVTARAETLDEGLKAIALDELNIKEYKSAEDAGEFISYKLKPQLKTIGPKYGKKLGMIKAFLEGCDAKSAKEVVEAVRGGGEYVLAQDNEVVLKEEDLQIFTESKTGFISASDKGVTVALNTQLTEELIIEGIERELVSKVQAMRKEADFSITDRIHIYYIAEGKVKSVLSTAAFKEDVLALSVNEGSVENADIQKEVDVNGEKATLALVRAVSKRTTLAILKKSWKKV
ncbi:MAG: isoleucine--tRNA ligase [Clostridia bacterium]|nr:isoleucine--tRNA ligase [Clostridia bacterium]